MLFISNKEDFKKYGLPFRTHPYVDIVYDFTPQAFAKYYYLDHQRLTLPRYSRAQLDAERQWESTTIAIALFLVEYLTQTSLGEARHFYGSSDAKICKRCLDNFMSSREHDRVPASAHLMKKFKTMEEAHTELLHIFWDHTWKFGMGGWLWGNTAWIAYRLYEGLKKRDLNEISKWIDVVSGITHNGGSCLISKYPFYSYNSAQMNQVLWAKYYGYSCCYQFLRKLAFKGEWEPCDHAKPDARVERSVWKAQVLRPGYEARQLCRRCWIPLPLDKMSNNKSLCKGACQTCTACVCKLAGKMCGSCNKVHTGHFCNEKCPICFVRIDKYKPHPRCHGCQESFSTYPFKSAHRWQFLDKEIILLTCANCYEYQHIQLEDEDDWDLMEMKVKLTEEQAIEKGAWKNASLHE